MKIPAPLFPSAKIKIETYNTYQVLLGIMSTLAGEIVCANIGSTTKAKIKKYNIPISGTIQEAFRKKIEAYEKKHPEVVADAAQ